MDQPEAIDPNLPPRGAKIKSLTKRALRRLFGKSTGLPAGSDAPTRSGSADQLSISIKEGTTDQDSERPQLSAASSCAAQSAASVSTSPIISTNTESAHATSKEQDSIMKTEQAALQSKKSQQSILRKQESQSQTKQTGLFRHDDKENVPPTGDLEPLSTALSNLNVDGILEDETHVSSSKITSLVETEEISPERAEHLRFIGEALDMARLALRINETPVGCVLVCKGKIVARGMNATNVTRNGTRHAEFMALSALLSYPPKDAPPNTRLKPKAITDKEAREKEDRESLAAESEALDNVSETSSFDQSCPHEGNEDGSKGHLYPYGQKLMPDSHVPKSIIKDCILYVTVEPCIMCASMLRQFGIKKVYFGAVNDKFGGTGGVFSIHANSLPVSTDGQTASAHPMPRATQLPDGTGGTLGTSTPVGGGDGGDVEPGYEVEGGWGRDEAVGLLRRFYVQENGRAPVPRKKEGRAARLAAMMDKDSESDGEDGEKEADEEDEEKKEYADIRAAENKESDFQNDDGKNATDKN